MRTLDVDLDAVAAEHLDSGGALTDIRDAADLVGHITDRQSGNTWRSRRRELVQIIICDVHG